MRATELFVGGWNEEGDRLGRMRSDTRHGEEKVKQENKEKCTRFPENLPPRSPSRPICQKNLGYARMHEKKNKSANWDLR